MKADAPTPLTALRREALGPRGQQAGTITTNPDEIDEIFKGKYGGLDVGNVRSIKEHVERYMEKYDDYIFKRPQAEIENITGDDVYETIREQKETAGGLDQWTPASLKLFTRKACGKFAELMNMVEEGAKWLESSTTARAAFLPKGEEPSLDPLEHRVLLMLSTFYRTWAKAPLKHLQP